MYPAQFEYHTPGTVKEALDLLGRHKDDAKLLAGGHSLLPAMKLRLAQPKHLVDLRKVSGLSGIKEEGGALVIGAMTTHYQVESSPVVKSKCPMLAAVAGQIGDPMVRNMARSAAARCRCVIGTSINRQRAFTKDVQDVASGLMKG